MRCMLLDGNAFVPGFALADPACNDDVPKQQFFRRNIFIINS